MENIIMKVIAMHKKFVNEWMNEWMNDWLNDWWIDWMIDWLDRVLRRIGNISAIKAKFVNEKPKTNNVHDNIGIIHNT